MRLILLWTSVTVSALIAQGCRQIPQLSPCQARVRDHLLNYQSRNIPPSEYYPVLEEELRKCIEEKKSKAQLGSTNF
jgi:hypothetical protein